MLELYHWEPNTFSLKTLIALKEKGLAFESRYLDPTDFSGEARLPALNLEAENNPETEGPILVHEGQAITESFFILEYLDDAFPDAPLRPGDPEGDWKVRVWARFLGERTAPGVATLGCKAYLVPALRERRLNDASVLDRFKNQERRVAWEQALTDSYSKADLAESRRKVALTVEKIEEALAQSDWLAAERYTMADIAAFAFVNCLPKLAPEVCNEDAAPRTMAWLERIRARPAVREALAMSRTGRPDEAFAPGPEHARWG